MINKTELSGCWGQISQREGWSNKISKSKWLVVNLIFSIFITSVGLWIVSFFFDGIWFESAWIAYFIVVFTGLTNHKSWNRDQEKTSDRDTRDGANA